MTQAVFETPSDQELEEIASLIGGSVEKGEEYVRTLVWSAGQGSARITYDVLGRSIRVLFLSDNGEKVVDVFREGAFHLAFVSGLSSCEAVVDFATESLSGKMRVGMFPNLTIFDSMLLS